MRLGFVCDVYSMARWPCRGASRIAAHDIIAHEIDGFVCNLHADEIAETSRPYLENPRTGQQVMAG
jgi:hypothetical protein